MVPELQANPNEWVPLQAEGMGKEALGSFVWGVSGSDVQYDWEFQVTILIRSC